MSDTNESLEFAKVCFEGSSKKKCEMKLLFE
jgi:hypothetical protein